MKGIPEDGFEKRHNLMVEDIVVTPFFEKHRRHKPAIIKLHAEIREDGDWIVLESKVPGHKEEDIKVSATTNTIDVDLILEKKEKDEIKFHNSYFTPQPIDPAELKIEHKKDTLYVMAKKKKK